MIRPFQHIVPHQAAHLLIVCDHAEAALPASVGNLGLTSDQLASHIAWDIGAAKLAKLLAGHLGAHCILAGVSRLVVDCNRAPHSPGWMPEETCGVAIPGNVNLSQAHIQARQHDWYDPYHHAIARTLRSMAQPVVLAIHSFTPVMNDQPRPWHVGILWNRDDRLAKPMIAGLRQMAGIEVGDNQPYSGQILNYTLDHHAGRAGLPHLSIEVRQDLIANDQGVLLWGQKLLHVFRQMGL